MKLNDKELDTLAADVRKLVHNQYFLADLLEKGIAYHIGYLPTSIRQRIEKLFKEGKITAMFCTSTLVEGVNLPADDLFVTTYYNGRSQMGDTQGSGKSLSMVFYAGIVVTEPEFDNPTLVVLTDRNDLDNQLYNTFAASSKLLLRQTPKHAESREHLRELLDVKAGGIIFTTIQKFGDSDDVINTRRNIIFLADEAHRSQYGLDEKLDRETGEWKAGMAKHIPTGVGMLYRFCHEVQIGDYVVYPSKTDRMINIGQVTGDYT